MLLSKNVYAIARAFQDAPEQLREALLGDPCTLTSAWNSGRIPRECLSGQSSAPIKVSELMRRECLYDMRDNDWTVKNLTDPQVRGWLAENMRRHWKDGNPTLPINVAWVRDVCGTDVPTELAEVLVGHVVRCGLCVNFQGRELMVVDFALIRDHWYTEPFTLEGGIEALDYIFFAKARCVEVDVDSNTDLSQLYPTQDEDEEGAA